MPPNPQQFHHFLTLPQRLAAWAGVCPSNHESAGKQKSAARKGNVHLKTDLVTAAVCGARRKGSHYKDNDLTP